MPFSRKILLLLIANLPYTKQALLFDHLQFLTFKRKWFIIFLSNGLVIFFIIIICWKMLAEIPSSSLTNPPDMSTAMCGQFLFVEFLIFFVVFLVGFASNILFILLSFKKMVNTKGCCKSYNDYLVHCSIANLFLMVNMPFDIIGFTTNGSWFFGEFFCR